jgi:hypothetical protein
VYEIKSELCTRLLNADPDMYLANCTVDFGSLFLGSVMSIAMLGMLAVCVMEVYKMYKRM